jgi:sirohydrochlorin ferrochelatase
MHHWQTLAWYEEVLGAKHPDTLTSVYCLARLLAEQHYVDESLLLYERASAGYSTTLGNDHPTTVACYQHYAELSSSIYEQEMKSVTWVSKG